MVARSQVPSLTRRRLLATAAAGAVAVTVRGGPAAAGRPGGTLGDGERLYDVVVDYSRWRHHRTGTGLGTATTRFFQHELRKRGADADRWPYAVDLFDWSAHVRVGRTSIPTLPLYYEAVGQARSDSPFIRSVTLPNAATVTELQGAIDAAAAAGASVAVIPTFGFFPAIPGVAHLPFGPYGALIGVNVEPHGPRSGVHTLLVSGEHADRVAAGPTRASVRSRIVAGSAELVTAWFHQPVPDPVIVTTPLTGWFTCAGERGTGIAIALDLAAELAASGEPVFVLGTTSHEFENFGIAQYLAANSLTPRAVIHIGASAAAGVRNDNGGLDLAPLRLWNSTVPTDALSTAMAGGGWLRIPQFLGEGTMWAAALPSGTPLLSISGSFPLFHTPQDTPAAATDPQLLATAYQALRSAADVLL